MTDYEQIKPITTYFVYYNERNIIVSLMPIKDTDSMYQYIEVPISEVSEFLDGALIPSDFIVKIVNGNKKIVKREVEVNHYRPLSSILHVIGKKKMAAIKILNNLTSKKIIISVSPSIISDKTNLTSKNKHSDVLLSINELELYIVAKNNPFFLIKHIKINVNELLTTGSIEYIYENNLEDVDVITTKIFNSYSYEVLP